MNSGSELETLIKVYTAATASLIYSYYIVPIAKSLITRLISILPVLILFVLLPLSLHTFQLRGLTAFFLLWLANFRLILLAFGQGPLAPPISLTTFLTSALFPISLQTATKTQTTPNNSLKNLLLFLTKLIIYASIIYIFQLDYKRILHPHLVLIVYCVFLYVAVETTLAIAVQPVKLFLGRQYEFCPQFNEPYLSTSLQNFWGRRWNLIVTNILHPTVYHPVCYVLKPRIGRMPASFAAITAAFTVSGLMHEIIWFYFTKARPSWEVTSFFVLQGVCTAVEVVVKRVLGGRVKVGAIVSTPLTLGFVVLTANWLFFPQLLRYSVDELVISEYAPLVRLVTQFFK